MLLYKLISPSRLFGAIVAALLLLPSFASATIVTAQATPFTGEAVTATLTLDDESQAGNLVITLEIDAGALTGDLRSFYAQIADESLLAGLSVSGADVNSSAFSANSVSNLGNGTRVGTINEACSGGGCDFGVEIGVLGFRSPVIQSLTFVLSHISEDLTVALFADQSFALRINDIGPVSGDAVQNSYSKLTGLVVVPEPSTAILMLLGLAGLTAAGRKR